jgi:hypothetical protein
MNWQSCRYGRFSIKTCGWLEDYIERSVCALHLGPVVAVPRNLEVPRWNFGPETVSVPEYGKAIIL